MVTNDSWFPVYWRNPEYISYYIKEVAWVATKKKVVCFPQSGSCTLSQIETSGKEKEEGGKLLLSSRASSALQNFLNAEWKRQ